MKHRDSSCFADMFCDAPAQYGDYSELEKCPMWGMWVKEGGDEEFFSAGEPVRIGERKCPADKRRGSGRNSNFLRARDDI